MHSQSTKSASGSDRPARWRVARTLKRHTEFRAIEPDDFRYFWAAYKKFGMKGELGLEAGLNPEEFTLALDKAIHARCQMAWTLLAPVDGKTIPVGAVFAAWSPFENFLIIVGVAWMPWASKRVIIESTINFVAKTRKDYMFQGFTLQEHKRLYEICAMHGLCRRVGTSYIALPGKAVAVFETIGVKNK